ncbi:MAG: DUF1127 domain-containing protein [Acidiferrobacterales bacterium]|nr:DUF1127 domain-containing protein [Acidiferrobacterales bacterium]
MKHENHLTLEEGFKARLQHLAGFSGIPHWSFDLDKPVSHVINNKVEKTEMKTKKHSLITRSKLNFSRLLAWIQEERQFRANVRELRSLDDHALRDIGLHRGDIAVLASRFHTVELLNQEREALARPVCQIVPFPSKESVGKRSDQRQAIDNAA